MPNISVLLDTFVDFFLEGICTIFADFIGFLLRKEFFHFLDAESLLAD